MDRKIKSFIISLGVVSAALYSQEHTEEDTNSVFFSELEKNILQEYQLCTGDSLPSRKTLLKWKSDINFLTESPDYPALLKKYAAETGIHPADVRPCEIINWSIKLLRDKNEASALLEQSKKNILSKRADSLYLQHQLLKNPAKPYQFEKIPFGISKKGFLMLLADQNRHLTDKGNYIILDSIRLDTLLLTGAFHFDEKGSLSQYELESRSSSLDSLDPWIRPQANQLAAIMQQKIGTDADHSYRVGRFDITQGRLAILKFWNLADAAVYTGLATSNYRYYAKLIVRSKTKSNEMQKDTVH